MKRSIAIALLILAFIVPTTVCAQDIRGYAGIGLGMSSVDLDYQPIGLGTVSEDDSDTTFKLFGGIIVNPYFSVDFGYINLGEYSANESGGGSFANFTAEASAFYAAAVGHLPLNKKELEAISLYGKVGLAAWDVDLGLSTNLPLVLIETGDSGTDLMFGIGIQGRYGSETNSWIVRLEYERFAVSDSDVDILGVAVAYVF